MNGENIKKLRKQFNLSMQDFGDRVGVSPRTVESWEQGRRPVPKHISIIVPFLFDEYEGLVDTDY